MDFIADILKRLLASKPKVTQTEIQRATGIPQPRLSDWSRVTPETTIDAIRLLEFAKTKGIEGDPRLLKRRKRRPASQRKA